jgi:DNA repair exonuclease SbcCD ATPase subunit
VTLNFARTIERELAAAQQRADEAVRAEQDVRQILDTYVGVEARAEKAEADYTRVAREFNDLSAKSTFELANLKARVATLASLLEQMLNVAENADETGYVTDCGFIDLDKLHAEVRSALAPATKETK